MRLLKKSEIDSAKAGDRKRDIDEGSKLAKRVDALREAQATEEASLEKFRRETIAHINEEIISKTYERDSLSKEVYDLEDRKKIALLPLDSEWLEVKAKQDELTEYAQKLNQEKLMLIQSKKDFDIEEDKQKVEKRRISDERNRSIKSLTETETNREESVKVLTKNKRVLEETEELLRREERKAKAKEKALQSAEVILRQKEKKLEEREKDINNQNIFLADQRKTLERAFNRLKK